MKYNYFLPTYEEYSEFSGNEIQQIFYRLGTYNDRVLLSHICCKCKPTKFDAELISSTRDIDEKGNICVKCFDKEFTKNEKSNSLVSINSPKIAVHPAVEVSSIDSELIHNPRTYLHNHVCCFEFGEYPTKLVTRYDTILDKKKNRSINELRNIEKKYRRKQLELTGKKYTIDDREFDEYTDGENKYIRYKDKSKLSRHYWIHVKPITWIYNEDLDIAISYYPLVGGIPFTKESDYYGNFNNTSLKKYFDEHFSIEILPLKEYQLEKSMLKMNVSDEIKQICYELIENNFPVESYGYTTDEIIYNMKSEYPDLKEDDYKLIAAVILKYQSIIGQNPSYIEDMNRKKEEELNKKVQEDIEKQNKEIEERLEKQKENQIIMNAVNDVLSNMPKGLSNEEIVERIYKQNSNITNKQLIEILNTYKQRISNNNFDNDIEDTKPSIKLS